MLTKWTKELLAMTFSNSYALIPEITWNDTSKKALVAAKSPLNNTYYITGRTYGATSSVINSELNESKTGYAIGSGTTPPTENDYTLDHQITSGFTGSATVTPVYDSENNKLINRVTITISNTGSTALTIAEVALFNNVETASAAGSSVSTRKAIMADRTLLNTPITIEPNTAGVIFYDFIEYEPTVG